MDTFIEIEIGWLPIVLVVALLVAGAYAARRNRLRVALAVIAVAVLAYAVVWTILPE